MDFTTYYYVPHSSDIDMDQTRINAPSSFHFRITLVTPHTRQHIRPAYWLIFLPRPDLIQLEAPAKRLSSSSGKRFYTPFNQAPLHFQCHWPPSNKTTAVVSHRPILPIFCLSRSHATRSEPPVSSQLLHVEPLHTRSYECQFLHSNNLLLPPSPPPRLPPTSLPQGQPPPCFSNCSPPRKARPPFQHLDIHS